MKLKGMNASSNCRLLMFCILYSFKKEDAFIGYSSDTKAAVVLQASVQLRSLEDTRAKQEKVFYFSSLIIFNNNKQVLQLSKKLLLQMATPDAVIRTLQKIPNESNFLMQVYFHEQEHSSLAELLQRMQLQENNVLLQVFNDTVFDRLLSYL